VLAGILLAAVCTFIWLVMQAGNGAGGKGCGTLLGCMVIVAPLGLLAAWLAIVVAPFLLALLPPAAFFLAVALIIHGCCRRKA
jgi:hypothetical protein